jgi:transcription initiation factor TFIIIB Brf1 subunit/transcription initiation factor TFIIB
MICDECGGAVVLATRGELVCEACGLVSASGPVDTSPITRRGDEYLGPGGDGHGPALSVQNTITMTTTPTNLGRLRTVDARAVGKRDRSAKRLYVAVHDLALRLALPPEMEDRTYRVASRTVEAKALRGWEFSLVAGGAVYYAIMERDGYVVPDGIVDATTATHMDRREDNIRAAFKEMEHVMGGRLPRADARAIGCKIALRLGLTPEVFEVIKRTAVKPTANPAIDAGAILYDACRRLGLDVPQRRFADALGTTDVSIRKRLGKASNTPGGLTQP